MLSLKCHCMSNFFLITTTIHQKFPIVTFSMFNFSYELLNEMQSKLSSSSSSPFWPANQTSLVFFSFYFFMSGFIFFSSSHLIEDNRKEINNKEKVQWWKENTRARDDFVDNCSFYYVVKHIIGATYDDLKSFKTLIITN